MAALTPGTPLDQVGLRAANVVVERPEGRAAPPPGEYVAVSIHGAGDWGPEAAWRPSDADAPTLVNDDLDAAARAAGVPYASTRSGAEGCVTVFLPPRRSGCRGEATLRRTPPVR
jgi:hypothetical protein